MMKKILILMVLIVTNLSAIERFNLIQSKNDKVCKSVMNLLNNDAKLDFQELKEFNWVKWDANIRILDYYGLPLPNTHYEKRYIDFFDINNDGRPEIVLLEKLSFRGKLNDSLSYYFNSYKSGFIDGISIKRLNKIRLLEVTRKYKVYLDEKNKYKKGSIVLTQFDMFPLKLNNHIYLAFLGRNMNKVSPRVKPFGFDAKKFFKKDYIVILEVGRIKNKLNTICILKEKNGDKV